MPGCDCGCDCGTGCGSCKPGCTSREAQPIDDDYDYWLARAS